MENANQNVKIAMEVVFASMEKINHFVKNVVA
jgi:hypothetical protein